jgi:DNA-binding transcriptional MerR regulator
MGDDPNLISKKELLDQTGISYGQLYRWKRKGLIPESWFQKKSAFTGQETFFPRSEMLARVERIKGMKDDLALDDLADLLAPAPSGLQVGIDELVKRNIVSKETLDLLFETRPLTDPLSFEAALHGWFVDGLLRNGDIGLDEGRLILSTLAAHHGTLQDQRGQFLFLRKRGVGFCLVLSGTGTVHPDPEARIVAQREFLTLVGEFRIALSGDKP